MVVVWFFVIIIPTPVSVFDLDFDWGVAIKEVTPFYLDTAQTAPYSDIISRDGIPILFNQPFL